MRKDFENYNNRFLLDKDWVFPFSEVPRDSKIILYGAGDVGQAYYYQINKTQYCDISAWTDKRYLEWQEWGFSVCSVFEALQKEYDYVVIAVSESVMAREICRILIKSGVEQEKIIWIGNQRVCLGRNGKSIIDYRLKEPIIKQLLNMIRRRGMDVEDVVVQQRLEEISNLVQNEVIVIPRLVVEMSTVCSLRCEGCNNLMPLYSKPTHIPLERVLLDIKKILENVESIITIELLGGEPFCYPYFEDVLEYVNDSKQIHEVEVTTNGTIIPKVEVLKALSNKKVTVKISLYDDSDKGRELRKRFIEEGVRYEVASDMVWIDSGDVQKRERDKNSSLQYYMSCESSIFCKTIYNGRLFACARAASLYDLGICTEKEGVVDLTNDKDSLKDEIMEFFLKQSDPACDYCNLPERWRLIEAGKQISKG